MSPAKRRHDVPVGELHLQLAVTFPKNAKVRRLNRYGRDARGLRDLYVQMLLFCKETRSDGFVGTEEIALLVFPDAEKNGMRDAGRLVEVGLLERADDGYQVGGWLERNPSREAIERKSHAKSRGARHANHRRWHVEQDSPEPGCEWCRKESRTSDQTTDRNTDQTSEQTSDQLPIGDAKRSDSKETESEEETQSESEEETGKHLGRQKPAGVEVGSDADPDFAAFWDVYPRRVAKGQARKAWKTAVVKGSVDPKAIILGAERYRDDYRRQSRSIDYTKHPGTWLNGECWLERDDAETSASGATRISYPTSPWAQ
jgi:hypothetical protein